MVLPETWTAALLLLALSAAFFVLWPNLFKMAGTKWRFELFSLDFSVGCLMLALIAAYTLGSRGAELDFSDSMLVAGRRAQVMAVGAGMTFALGNMLYLGTIALMGLSNATLLTFSVLGCGLGLLQVAHGHFLLPVVAFALLAGAAALAFLAAQAARPARVGLKTMQLSTKGAITGILAGLIFTAVWPVLALAQTDDMGIGAYGGLLMAAIGILIATLLLNFFFMNISLEGGRIGYRNYLSGSGKSHALGAASGIVWTGGALALYMAKTGVKEVTGIDAWLVPFAAALLTVVTGVAFWQKIQLTPDARKYKWTAMALFAAGIAALVSGLRA